ncbi:hypothetical protein [Streptomyces mirabilis]|uniref:hypothetical protein n=1 Tax=Streptomyces mirabilis TaxID=68239 RepID=UPI0036E55D87
MGQGHGWEGAVLKLLRGKDFEFTEPDPAPSHVFAVADAASLPALNSLRDVKESLPDLLKDQSAPYIWTA